MLTVVILAKNEENHIVRAIESVAWADHILVIDNNSTDDTASLAKKHKARVIHDKTELDFAALRNRGLAEAPDGWVFFLDADEYVDETLAENIQRVSGYQDNPYDAYEIRRSDVFWNHTMRFGEVYKARTTGICRLIKRQPAARWVGRVHESLSIPNAAIARLEGQIMHTPHQTIGEFLQHINAYSTIRASELASKGAPDPLSLYGSLFLYPPLKFVYSYVLCAGFLDGMPGFIYSFMMSFHSFLVRAKWYQQSVLMKQKPMR